MDTDCAAESQNTVLMCCVLSFCILTLDPLIKAIGLLAGNCEYPTSNRILYQKDGLQTPGESTLIKDRLPGSPYVLVLIARSTFKLGLVGASSGSQVPFSRVSHLRQAAG